MEGKRHEPFKVLKTWPGNSSGTTHKYHELVKCPDCGYEFVRDVSSGCFHHNVTPWACPKCNYPWTYYNKLKEEISKPRKKEVWNPSKRLVPNVSESVEEM